MSLKKVKFLDIVFENCGFARISIKNIYNWGMGEITKTYYACNEDECDTIYKSKWAFIIFEDLENLYYESHFKDKKKLIDRIKNFKDITHIDVVYEDDTNEYVAIPWGSNNQFYNAFQILNKIKFKNWVKRKNFYSLEFYDEWNIKKFLNYLIYLFKLCRHRINKFLNKDELKYWG